MASEARPLRDLLTFTRDGEWGAGQPTQGHVESRVIRGTDFEPVRLGALEQVPTRFIPEDAVRRKALLPGDILIETAGGTKDQPTGRTLLIRKHHLDEFGVPVVCASFARFLRADAKQIEPGYLYWWLQSLYAAGEMDQHQVQHTGVARFQYTRFAESTSVPLPPRKAQQRIAEVLGALDDKIEVNGRTNRTLEALMSLIFRSWFVDFDPVQAKRDGRRPVAVSDDVLRLFPDSLESSVLGPIPRGWTTSTIGSVVRVVGGSTPRTGEPRFWNGDVCWVTPRDLSRLTDPVVLGSERYITREGLAQISSGLLPSGTVLLSSRAPIGYLAITELPVSVNQGFIAILCEQHVTNTWVLKWLEQSMEEILSRAGGTTFAEISKSTFRAIPVIVPPREIVGAFEALAGPMHRRIVANVRETACLLNLRNSLLPALFSGDMEIGDAEKSIAEVA